LNYKTEAGPCKNVEDGFQDTKLYRAIEEDKTTSVKGVTFSECQDRCEETANMKSCRAFDYFAKEGDESGMTCNIYKTGSLTIKGQ